MKVFIICSAHFYHKVNEVRDFLEEGGHEIVLPNSFDNPFLEDVMREKEKEEYINWKKNMFEESQNKVKDIDAVLVLNFEKNGQQNYVGGATFLELYDAFKGNKKIFLHNPIPEGILYDEIHGFGPVIINGDLSLIK